MEKKWSASSYGIENERGGILERGYTLQVAVHVEFVGLSARSVTLTLTLALIHRECQKKIGTRGLSGPGLTRRGLLASMHCALKRASIA